MTRAGRCLCLRRGHLADVHIASGNRQLNSTSHCRRQRDYMPSWVEVPNPLATSIPIPSMVCPPALLITRPNMKSPCKKSALTQQNYVHRISIRICPAPVHATPLHSGRPNQLRPALPMISMNVSMNSYYKDQRKARCRDV